jgi:pilus assembly protein CpaE
MQLRTIGLLMGSPDLIGRVRNCLSKLPLRIVMEAREIVSAAAQLRQTCPNVLLLEVPVSKVLVSDLLGVVAGLPVPPAIVAVGAEPTPEVLLEIMQLGIRGYLSAPFDAAKAWQILERLVLDNQTPAERHTGKTLGFLSAAGGAGATTLACHIAAGLHSATGGNTVLADFDTAAGMVGFCMNIESPHSALDAVNNAESLDLNL